MFARNTLAVVLAMGGLAAAQLSIPSISSQCTTALTSILANSDAATCLSLGDAITVATLPSNTSVIPSVTNWLGAMCAASPCSNATLDTVTSTILTGCQSDLQADGVSLSTSQAQQEVETEYLPARDVGCSKSNGDFCLINTLNAVQSLTGQPLSIGYIMTADWVTLANTLNTSSLCTDCNQAAYATLRTQIPSVQNSQVEQVIASRCGSAFVNGNVPGDVTLGNTASGSSSSGATGLKAALVGVLGSAGAVAALLL